MIRRMFRTNAPLNFFFSILKKKDKTDCWSLNDADTGIKYSSESIQDKNSDSILKVKTVQSNKYLKLAKNLVISSASLQNLKSSENSSSASPHHLTTSPDTIQTIKDKKDHNNNSSNNSSNIRKSFFAKSGQNKSFDDTILNETSTSSLVKNILRTSGLLNNSDDEDKISNAGMWNFTLK